MPRLSEHAEDVCDVGAAVRGDQAVRQHARARVLALERVVDQHGVAVVRDDPSPLELT